MSHFGLHLVVQFRIRRAHARRVEAIIAGVRAVEQRGPREFGADAREELLHLRVDRGVLLLLIPVEHERARVSACVADERRARVLDAVDALVLGRLLLRRRGLLGLGLLADHDRCGLLRLELDDLVLGDLVRDGNRARRDALGVVQIADARLHRQLAELGMDRLKRRDVGIAGAQRQGYDDRLHGAALGPV